MKATEPRVAGPDWRAIGGELPDIAVRSATRIGEGWSAVAYRVNDDLVFKFPKRRTVWDELDRETVFLAQARGQLPLAVPEQLRHVRESAGAPHGYAIYRNIPGSAVQPHTLTLAARASLARALADFLRALHDIDPGPLASVLPREDEQLMAQQYQSDADAHVAPQLSAADRRRLSEVIAGHLRDPLNFGNSARVLHADLSADHVLCAGESVSGILDWGDVCLGDPDYDFGYLYDDFGEAFVREVADHYGHADPDRLVRKARYFSVADQIGTIVHGGEEALAGDVEESWHRLRALLAQE